MANESLPSRCGRANHCTVAIEWGTHRSGDHGGLGTDLLNDNIREILLLGDLPPFSGPIFAGKFQFSGMDDSGRWTGKDDEKIEVFRGADRLHPAAG